jgi:hypothetical protein
MTCSTRSFDMMATYSSFTATLIAGLPASLLLTAACNTTGIMMDGGLHQAMALKQGAS